MFQERTQNLQLAPPTEHSQKKDDESTTNSAKVARILKPGPTNDR
jgi:hypothetical protein